MCSRSPRLLILVAVAAGCNQTATLMPLPDAAAGPTDMKIVHDFAPPPCVAADGGACVTNVTINGQVVDSIGDPVRNLVTSMCAEICFFGNKTDSTGKFSINTGKTAIDYGRYAVLLHGQPTYASYYIRPPALVAGVANFPSPLTLLASRPDGPPIAMDKSAQMLTAGDATLSLTKGTDVLLDVDDAAAGALGQKFRPLTVTPATLMPFIDASAPPAALFSFSPFEVVFTQPARLSFNNLTTAMLPAGQAVEFLGQRGLVAGSVVGVPPAGDWATVATGKVSSDGTTIDMDPGMGVTGLTWIAIRKAK